jgi:hypothetical protein
MNESKVWILAAVVLTSLALIVAPAGGAEPDQKDNAKTPAAPAPPTQEELEQKFAQDLSGATLVGHFTVDERSGSPSEDRYKIAKVTKLEGDTWRFDAQIIYGNHDVTLPLPLTVKWAGDTPVITLTDLTIPGLGTYTARVLFYRGQYAGTWSASDHGGEMWGRIEKPSAIDKAKQSEDKKPTDGK